MAGPSDGRSIAIRLTVLLLGFLTVWCTPLYAQKQPERYWLAGRYDGNPVVVYFDAVTFNGTMTANAREIPPPVVGGFFDPVELPASYIARFQATPNAEHFALGDRYDLLLGNGIITMVKLTTLVGCLHLADGSLRYDVRAQWKTGKKPGGAPTQVLGAWLAPIPTLHILAVEEPMPTIAVALATFPNC